jgi:outer membrane protein assembly factor BamB
MGDSRVPELEPVASPPQRELDYYDLQLSEEPLGEGGQTVVYEASVPDSEPPETVAVRQSGDRGFTKSVKREELVPFVQKAETWASLARRERTEPRWSDSDHIVGVVAVGENLPWAGLEYMDGGSLAHRLEGTDGLPVEEAVWVGERLCQGLQVAHNTGVAHLDVKPENILFRKTDQRTWDVPKIADWGLARNLLDDTSDSMNVLSTRYAAPEQLDREEFGRPGTATDIYQVGAVLYALLTGSPPYTGTERSVMFDIVSDETPTPSNRRSGLSEKLDTVVRTALEARKSDRYDSIAQFRRALGAIRAGDRLPPVVAQRVTTRETPTDPPIIEDPPGGTIDTTDAASVTRWEMFGGGPARRGAPDGHTGPDAPVTTRWRFDTLGPVRLSPAVVDGTVYVGSYDNSLYAVDAATGNQQWQFDTDGNVRSSPAVVNGTVYVGSDDESLYAVDAATGNQQWQFDTDGRVESSPAVVDGTVYVGSYDNSLYAVDVATGEQQWQFNTSAPVESSPAVADGTVYVGSNDNNLYAVDVATGTGQWRFDTPWAGTSSPAVVGGTVYVGGDNYNLYAVDAATGEQQWQFDTDGEVWQFATSGSVKSSPAVVDSTVYVGSNDNNLYAVDAATGEQQWQFDTDGEVRSSPAVVDGTVYVGSDDYSLYAVEEKG